MKPRKVKLFRFLAARVRVRTGKAPELEPLRLVCRQGEPEAFEPVFEPVAKPLGVALVLEAGQKVIGETEVVRLRRDTPGAPDG